MRERRDMRERRGLLRGGGRRGYEGKEGVAGEREERV